MACLAPVSQIDLLCPSCHRNKIVRIGKIPPTDQFAGRVLDRLLSGASFYRCTDCHLHFRWPRLSKAELNKLYEQGNPDNWQSEPGDRHDWQAAARYLNANVAQGAILEIGCFDGRFLKYLGSAWQRYGVEINHIAALRARENGICILDKNFYQIDHISMQFDAVVAFDVIEHTEDPRYFLEQMARLTRHNGVIIVSSGNTHALSWKLMGSKYWYCAIAEHLSFINEKWCLAVARALNLHIELIEKFSHAGRGKASARIMCDVIKNICYKFDIGIIGMLRKFGFGRVDIVTHKEMKHYPPSCISAKDHLIVFFRKK